MDHQIFERIFFSYIEKTKIETNNYVRVSLNYEYYMHGYNILPVSYSASELNHGLLN
jgi:hypothetical protein